MKHEWISIKKRYPDKDGYYLVCDKTGINIRHYAIKYDKYYRKSWKSEGILFWMLLPEMPGEKKYPF